MKYNHIMMFEAIVALLFTIVATIVNKNISYINLVCRIIDGFLVGFYARNKDTQER